MQFASTKNHFDSHLWPRMHFLGPKPIRSIRALNFYAFLIATTRRSTAAQRKFVSTPKLQSMKKRFHLHLIASNVRKCVNLTVPPSQSSLHAGGSRNSAKRRPRNMQLSAFSLNLFAFIWTCCRCLWIFASLFVRSNKKSEPCNFPKHSSFLLLWMPRVIFIVSILFCDDRHKLYSEI